MAKADVEIRVGVDDKASKKLKNIGNSMERMSGTFRKAGIAMVAVGVAIAGVLAKLTLDYAKAGDEIAKMSKRIGVSTETLSKWKYMADQSGTSLGAMEKAMKKLAMSVADAKDGLATYTREFEKISIDVQELEGLSPEDIFMKIALAVAAIEDPMVRASSAQKLFGRAGMELLPMLEDGAEGMKELSARASEFAVIFDEEAARAAEEFTDAMGTLKESLEGVGFALAETLVPVMTEFLEDKVIPTIKRIREWIEANEAVAKTLAAVGGALVVGGILLIGLSYIAKAIMAINAALIIMHGLMGPAGWAKLAVGMGIAAGAILGLRKLLEFPVIPEIQVSQVSGMPELHRGGIVPGPIGKEIPVMALGGESFGNAGGVNIYVGNFMGDESSLRAFSRKIKEIIGQDNRRTSFSGINRLEYFPGSSAP